MLSPTRARIASCARSVPARRTSVRSVIRLSPSVIPFLFLFDDGGDDDDDEDCHSFARSFKYVCLYVCVYYVERLFSAD